MKITVYTTTDCQYCKQEKDYLAANKLQYEEKNLEINKEFLTEMLALSNNFAGTPVTRVEKDDGSIVVLKGFTKGEFDTTFGFAEAPKTPIEEPVAVAPVPAPVVESTPVVETAASPVEEPKVEPAAPKTDELNSVLDKLEEKTTPVVTPPAETPPTNTPSVPDFPDPTKTTA